jgi:hypothetical protein
VKYLKNVSDEAITMTIVLNPENESSCKNENTITSINFTITMKTSVLEFSLYSYVSIKLLG